MIFHNTTDNDKLRMDTCSYSSISENGMRSLLRYPLPSLDVPFSFPSYVPPPPSFEEPFDDPNMEPLPFVRNHSIGHHEPALQSNDDASSAASFLQDEAEDCRSSSFTKKPLPTTDVQQQALISFFYPVADIIAPCKRSSDDLVSNQGPSKRPRTSTLQADPADENVSRFRPYQERQWRDQFKKLVEFKLENGHCSVPHSCPKNRILARWVKRQRYQYNKLTNSDPTSTMTTRRIQQLESIGFVWHSHESVWQEKLNELKAFKQREGHCNVPSRCIENAALSTWVKCQRRQYKLLISGSSSTLTLERLRVLESMDFVFDRSNK